MTMIWKRALLLVVALLVCGTVAVGCGRRPSRVQVLKDSVDLTDADARRKAFYEMGKWDKVDGELLDLVELTLLGETDALVRAQVARTLGKWGQPSSAATLVTCLEKDPHALVRAECALALGGIESEESRAALAGAVGGDSRAEVRVAAARALREHRHVESGEALVVALESGERDAAVRFYALESLRYLTGQDFGHDGLAWGRYLAEAEDPLAGYGKPPKQRKAAEPTLGMTAERQEKTREILGDLFPLERKEGPFD